METLSKLKILVSVIFIIIINSLFVLAAQPSLPTLLYGNVINPDLTPAISISVDARYVDSNGVEHTLTTKTLTAQENSNGNLAGYYFFNKGYLQARGGSIIVIKAEGVTRRLYANPGGGIMQVGAMILGSGTSTPQLSTDIDPELTTIPLSKTSTETDHVTSPDSNTGGLTEAEHIISPDSTEGESAEADQRTSLKPIPETSTQSSEDAKSQTEGTASSTSLPNLPTTVSGKVLDEKGSPIGGENVTVEWIDDNGIMHNTTTTTLTKEEAEELGNESLEGHYMFNNGEIKAKPNSEIKIISEKGNVTTEAKPGEKVRTDLLYLSGAQPSLKNNELESSSVRLDSNFVNDTLRFITEAKEEVKENPHIIIIALVIALLLFVVLLNMKKIKEKVKEMIRYTIIIKLKRDIKELGKMKVKNFMKEKVVKVTKNENIMEVIKKFISEDVDGVIVVEGKHPVGMITQKELLGKIRLHKKNFYDTKTNEIMCSSFETVKVNATFLEAIDIAVIQNMVEIPVITKKNELIGAVTQMDLAKELNKFISKNMFELSKLSTIPLVKSIVKRKFFLAKEDENLLKVMDCMIREGTDSAVFITKGSKDKKTEEVLDILTEREFIEKISNNPLKIKNLRIELSKNKNKFGVMPETNVFEANKLMIERGFRKIPVLRDREGVGIINLRHILRSMNSLLVHILSEKDKKLEKKLRS